ncbi:MAG TPA: elongation factor G [Planctomycetota bacterium]|nr:elongation factor G [Planctomycetota bacterium]
MTETSTVKAAANIPISRYRNIGIVAHIDAGKTTLTERILFYAGREHKIGEVHTGNTTTDYEEEERQRGITITSAAVSVTWPRVSDATRREIFERHNINIIDTPGHVDFTAEVERSLRVLDGAVMVFCGVAGVQTQSETVWRQANRYHVPRICFINKMDRNGADFLHACETIKKRLHAVPLPIQMPVGKMDDFNQIVDLVTNEIITFDPKDKDGNTTTRTPIPANLKEEVDMMRHDLFEKLGEHDDQTMEKYMAEQMPTAEELHAAIRRVTLNSVKEGSKEVVVPVMLGSAFKNRGVQLLLDGVLRYLPSPLDIPPAVGTLVDAKEPTTVDCPTDAKHSLAALAFKLISDKHGDLTFVRVYSGTLRAGDKLQNTRKNKKERIGSIYKMHADQREAIESVSAGDIAAVVGLKHTYTGDTLVTEGTTDLVLEQMHFPDTVISMAIEPKSNADKEKLGVALQKLAKEDPTFRTRFDEETSQMIISGMGELHLDIISAWLTRKHGVQANIGSPKVSYRETIQNSARAVGKFIQQSGGHGQFGVAEVTIEPHVVTEEEGENHIMFVDDIVGAAIPKEFIKSVEKGVRNAALEGILAGYPVINVKVCLVDGKFHDVDSSDIAFERAGRLAFREACQAAGLIILEPIMKLEVETPEEYLGNIIKDLNSRRAEIESTVNNGYATMLIAKVPLAKMFGYSTESRSMSQGRATYSMEPSEYRPIPRQSYKEILGRDL